MSSKWRKFRLEEQCERVTKGTTPTTVGGRFTESGINFIKVESIGNDGQIQEDKLAAIDTETDELLKRSRILSGDILFTIAGTIGRVSLFPEKLLPANTNQAVAIIRLENNSEIDRTYLYYALRSEVTKNTVAAGVVQAVQANFSLGSIKKLEIQAPSSIDEQRKIAKNLKALDDKIQLNHQINQTLEQMAQAIFKSWFVDFEPVKAKIAALEAGGSEEDALLAAMQAISGKDEAQLPRLQAEQPEQYAELRATAELFPSAMQDSELGEIPEGWSVPSFEDITVAKQGKYLAKDKMSPTISPDSNVPVWGGNGVLGYTKSCSYPAPVVLMTCRGSNCGLIRHTESEAWVSNNAFACSPRIGSVWFLLTYFNASSFDDCISGSAQPQITYSALRSKKLAIPIHEETCKRYSALIQAMFDQIIHLRNEALNLENLRDALLPKLLTGELKV